MGRPKGSKNKTSKKGKAPSVSVPPSPRSGQKKVEKNCYTCGVDMPNGGYSFPLWNQDEKVLGTGYICNEHRDEFIGSIRRNEERDD